MFARLGGLKGRGLGRNLGMYYNSSGQPIIVAHTGDTITYNVAGQPPGQVWLDQEIAGTSSYSGPFTIPMAPYTLGPNDRSGLYINNAYALVGGGKGTFLEQSTLVVNPAIPVGSPAPVPTATPNPYAGNGGSGGGGGGNVNITVATAPSIPGALPNGANAGPTYGGTCLSALYRFILSTGGGYATGSNRTGCSQTNSVNCDPQFFSTLPEAIGYALQNGEIPYAVSSANDPWAIIACQLPINPAQVYNPDGSLGSSGFSPLMIAAIAAVAFLVLK
jgi:hypothetical protein